MHKSQFSIHAQDIVGLYILLKFGLGVSVGATDF